MNYLDQPNHHDAEQEARADWQAERPDADYDYDAAQECDGCGCPVCRCEVPRV